MDDPKPTESDAKPADEPGPVADDVRDDPPSPFESADDEHRPVEEKGRENP